MPTSYPLLSQLDPTIWTGRYTVKQLRELYHERTGTNPPSVGRKAQLAAYVKGVLAEFEAYGASTLAEAQAAGYSGATKVKQAPLRGDQVPLLPYTGPLNPTELRQALLRDGCAVVPCPDYDPQWLEAFQAWLEAYGQKSYAEGTSPQAFVASDLETWALKNVPVSTRGIFKQWLAHTPAQWQARVALRSVFAQIYDCDDTDLISSYDGGSITFGERTIKPWFHNDQPALLPDAEDECYQAVLYLTASGPNDPGTLVYRGSHRIWADYNQQRPSAGYKWGLSDTDLVERLLAAADLPTEPVRYEIPAGHCLLFNSKVVHTSAPGQLNCQPRYVYYISMVPRTRLTAKELERHVKYYEQNKMTSHWCYGPFFNANGGLRTWGNPLTVPETPYYAEPEPAARRLIGYEA